MDFTGIESRAKLSLKGRRKGCGAGGFQGGFGSDTSTNKENATFWGLTILLYNFNIFQNVHNYTE